MNFFVFRHAYNDRRSWWEVRTIPHGTSPEPIVAENTQELIDGLPDGLYAIFTLANELPHIEVQVTTETVTKTKRQVIER